MLPVPPELLPLLALVLAAALNYQYGLTWHEYRTIHALKRATFPLLNHYWKHLIHKKGHPETDAEYITTHPTSVRETWQTLIDGGGSPHTLASLKRRPDGSLSDAHVVWTHRDGTQSEAYLFWAQEGTDVYTHHEASVVDPAEHLGGGQRDGDPRGVVRRALDMEVAEGE